MKVKILILLCFFPVAGATEAPLTSLRPMGRGLEAASEITGAPTAESIRDRSRNGLFRSLRPNRRTEKVRLFGSRKKRQLEAGKVCGDSALQGEPVGQVTGRLAGCGLSDAVRVRSVDGVVLSQPSVMDCATAKALKTWINNGVRPAVKRQGGGVSGLRVAAHYSCRTRNNKAGAKISEHGRGRAIDISAIQLKDGSDISVLRDWGRGRKGKALRKMHAAACGPFGTVLGPQADRYHQDHFHFDTARYRSGSYCR
ncbi:MAG: hypothetical protein CSA70_10245 [Rhodobacterales bacterium]|nr:MAG: hypothetical protein CSA70_10245 [Rhodobacterales bacterium]